MSRRLIDHPRIWAAVIAIILVTAVSPAAWRAWHGRDNDFEHYWNAAQAMRSSQDIYDSGEQRYVYPPLLAFSLQPLTLIPEPAAAVTWIVFSGLAVFLAVFVAAKEAAGRLQLEAVKCLTITAVAMALMFDKIRSLLNLGQSDALTLLGFALALRWMERKPVLAGVAIGFSANVKYISLIFVPYFLLKRNWRAAFSSIAYFLLFLFLPAIQIGVGLAIQYARAAFGGILNMSGTSVVQHSANVIDIAWNRSVSIPSTIFRLTRWLGWPDIAAIGIIGALFAATIAIVVRLVRMSRLCSGGLRPPELLRESIPKAFGAATTALREWMSLIVLALVFSPQTTLRHMVLLVLAFAVALAFWFAAAERNHRIAIGGAILLMLAALTLPPYGIGMNQAVWAWRAVGGASWCALIFLLVVIVCSGSLRVPKALEIRRS